MVLQRVEVARLGAQLDGDPGDLAGRPGMVGRELAALLGLAVAASSGGEDDRTGIDHLLAADGPPAG